MNREELTKISKEHLNIHLAGEIHDTISAEFLFIKLLKMGKISIADTIVDYIDLEKFNKISLKAEFLDLLILNQKESFFYCLGHEKLNFKDLDCTLFIKHASQYNLLDVLQFLYDNNLFNIDDKDLYISFRSSIRSSNMDIVKFYLDNNIFTKDDCGYILHSIMKNAGGYTIELFNKNEVYKYLFSFKEAKNYLKNKKPKLFEILNKETLFNNIEGF